MATFEPGYLRWQGALVGYFDDHEALLDELMRRTRVLEAQGIDVQASLECGALDVAFIKFDSTPTEGQLNG
jgi:hypothetical protein